jgi:peroxin-2
LLVLRAALFKLSIWDHDTTYGAALQNLKYTDARHQGPVHKPPTLIQKTLYGLTTVFGRYAWTKYNDWLLSHSSEYDDDDDLSQPPNNIRLLSQLTSVLSTTHSVAAFASFLTFLLNGHYRTLLDRILRLRLTPPTSQLSREVSFEYLNRQLVWHAFTEFLLFILPLVGIARWRRWISRAWRKVKATFRGEQTEDKAGEGGELGFLPERTCAICYQDQNPTGTTETEILAVSGGGGVVGSAQTDVTNPYECVPCGCVYCFVCLAQRLEAEEGEGWVCLRCGALVKKCKPWEGDVLIEEEGKAGVGKSVGFVEEGEEKLRVVEPRPEEDMGGSGIRGLDGSSTEWADVKREDETETDVHETTEDEASALSSSEDEAEEEEVEDEGQI